MMAVKWYGETEFYAAIGKGEYSQQCSTLNYR